MKPIQHIIFGVGHGDHSWEALQHCRAIAASVDATLVAFYRSEGAVPDDITARAARLEIPLESAITYPGPEGVARALLDAGNAFDDSVIGLASHARRRLTSAVVGSTATATLEASSEPLLLMGPNLGDPAGVTRVIACLDGSTLAESLLEPASRWAAAANLPLHLLRVNTGQDSAVGPGSPQTYLSNVANRLRTEDLRVTAEALEGDHAGKTIASYANEQAGTLTVLATHGHSGLRQITMGSVAMDVTRRATGPTLILRPVD